MQVHSCIVTRMKRILVTGGAGFIGSNFLRLALASTDPVWSECQFVVADSLTYAADQDRLPLITHKSRLEFHKLDIRDKDSLRNIPGPIQGIINFAAETHVDNSISNPELFIETNVLGTFNLLEIARTLKIRMLQVSTDEVYGSLSTGRAKEDSPLNPSSPYSASKASADLIALSYFKTFGIDLIVTRCTNNYGPWQFPEKLIPFFISRLKAGGKVPLYGTGENCREWISVEDHCRGIMLAYQKGKSGEIYNFGSGEEYSNFEITQILLKKLKLDSSRIEFVQDRLGHDYRYAVDSTKAFQELGWKSLDSFSLIIDELIECY